MSNTSYLHEKLVPAEVLRELARGSYEHLTIRIEGALDENKSLFLGEKDGALAVLATFKEHVVVGTNSGKYYRAGYEERDNGIRFFDPEQLDVPVYDAMNTGNYARNVAVSAVNAMLSGNKGEAKEKIAALVKLQESAEEGQDLASLIAKILQSDRDWKSIYKNQADAIRGELGEAADEIAARKYEPKFVGLYDGTIAEEEFPGHADEVKNSLSIIADKLESIHTKAETVFYPFMESASKTELAGEELEAVQVFAAFAEDYLDDMQGLREHVAFALNNEPCVMCLGQIHDAVSEAIVDYEIAGSFVERLASRYNEAA